MGLGGSTGGSGAACLSGWVRDSSSSRPRGILLATQTGIPLHAVQELWICFTYEVTDMSLLS